MKRAIKIGLLALVGCLVFALVTCENPAGGSDNREGEFTISLGNGSAGKAALYPPDWPDPGVTNPGGPLIEDLRFEITFTPVAVGKGEKREFKFDGDQTIGGKVKVGTYTVTMEVFEIGDLTNTPYANGSAESSPVEIVSTRKNNIKVLLYDAQNARMPVINVQPMSPSASYAVGDTATPLTITASVSDGGTLSYQWFDNGTTNSNSGGTSLGSAGGADTASFTPPTTSAGTTYYYCEVTNTNLLAPGLTTATVVSNVVTVKVIEPVTSITGPASWTTSVGTLNLTAVVTVNPATATNTTITWTIKTLGGTGATVSGDTLTTTTTGTVVVTATIVDGTATGDYTQDFAITVIGLTWTAVSGNPLGTGDVNDVAFGDGRFIVVGTAAGTAWSDDGITWTSGPISSGTLYGAGWGNDMFIVGGNFASLSYLESNIMGIDLISSPGISNGGMNQQVANIFYANNTLIIGNGWGGIWYLEDGAPSWVQATLPAGFNPNPDSPGNCAFGNGKFVTTCGSGNILYSSDGKIWDEVGTNPFGTTSIHNVAFGGPVGQEKFVAVGSSGIMAYSSDGISWTAVPDSGTASGPFGTSIIRGITYGGGLFVAGGASGKMAYSSDGLNWISQDGTESTFGTSEIKRIGYGNGRFVAVGQSGKIAYSD